MATYKVPQDVEAEDKLIGPFSFRQFIYLIIAALAGALAFILSKIFIGLIIIPIPVILFFLVLALPLKKDQPMETYLVAIVRFMLKPHLRLWEPEGELSLVEITAQREEKGPELKDLSQDEASARLRYLSQIVDTGGWASRGLTSPIDNLSVQDIVAAEAQGAQDVMDSSNTVSQNLDTLINQSDEERKQALIATMQNSLHMAPKPEFLAAQSIPPPTTPSDPVIPPAHVEPIQLPADPVAQTMPAPAPVVPQPTLQQTTSGSPDDAIVFNPYPSAIHQKIISPSGDSSAQTAQMPPVVQPIIQPEIKAQAPSEKPVSPDIMRLATSKDLSISTIAREAARLQKKHLEEEEVVVSLR